MADLETLIKDKEFSNVRLAIRALATALKYHQYCQERGWRDGYKSSRTSLAQELGVGVDRIKDDLSKFGMLFGLTFYRQAGWQWASSDPLKEDEDSIKRLNGYVDELFRRVEAFLDTYERLVWTSPLMIRIGLDHAFYPAIVSRVIQPFEQICAKQYPDVVVKPIVTLKNSIDLLDHNMCDDLDMILTFCPPHYEPKPAEGLMSEPVAFPMHLIAQRGSGGGRRRTSQEPKIFSAGWLRERTAILLKREVSHAAIPEHLERKIRESCQEIIEVDNFNELHRKVAEQPDGFGFSIPQLFNLDAHRTLERIRIPEIGFELRVCLIWPETSRKWHWRNARDNTIIADLAHRLLAYLRHFAKATFDNDELECLNQRSKGQGWYIYHVEKGQWKQGKLSIEFDEFGYINGVHTVNACDTDQLPSVFQVSGHMTTRRGTEHLLHIALLGSARSLDYLVSIIVERYQLFGDDPVLVGIWIARQLEDTAMKKAGGYMVISTRRFTAAELRPVVKEHDRQFGTITLDHPD